MDGNILLNAGNAGSGSLMKNAPNSESGSLRRIASEESVLPSLFAIASASARIPAVSDEIMLVVPVIGFTFIDSVHMHIRQTLFDNGLWNSTTRCSMTSRASRQTG
jgi:hypothetical protein